MRCVLIVRVGYRAIGALKVHSLVNISDSFDHSPQRYKMVAPRHGALAVLLLQVGNTLSAVVLLAVFVHDRVDRYALANSALNRCDRHFGCNGFWRYGSELVRVDVIVHLVIYQV